MAINIARDFMANRLKWIQFSNWPDVGRKWRSLVGAQVIKLAEPGQIGRQLEQAKWAPTSLAGPLAWAGH